MKKDPYEVLELSRKNAPYSEEELKKAFRKAAMRCHPELN